MRNEESHEGAFTLRLELLRARARRLELERQLAEADALADELRTQNDQLRNSVSFSLGRALLDAVRSPSELLRLPARLSALAREACRRQVFSAPESASVAVHGKRRPMARASHGLPLPHSAAPESLRGMRVAAVLDSFSAHSFSPECDLRVLSPHLWREEVAEFQPHLLLVESCWQGPGGAWECKVSPCSDTLYDLVAACREAGVPTVFWNKEDPLHFEAFIDAARLFDVVFTTDANCIPRYKRELGHGRVHLMPFALQPAIFQPITSAHRSNAFFFAGAYYPHLTQRARDFRSIIDALSLVTRVDIYDRNHGVTTAGGLAYPPEYRAMVRGGVAYDEVADLYRRYAFGVNLNTIKQSPTMFARRVFELIGSGCGVYGNYALGTARLLGDLVVSTDDPEQLFRHAWHEVRDNGVEARRRRAAAIRKVLAEHTYAHRLASIATAVGWDLPARRLPAVAVVARVENAGELAAVLTACSRQSIAPDAILVDAPASLRVHAPASVRWLAPDDIRKPVHALLGDCWVAPIDSQDYYGTHYLEDLLLATRYSDATAIGKANDSNEYQVHRHLAPRRAVFRADACPDKVSGLLSSMRDESYATPDAICIDSFEYAEGGSDATLRPSMPRDEGVAMHEALAFANAMPAAGDWACDGAVRAERLAVAFAQGAIPPGTSVFPKAGRLEICAKLVGGRSARLRTAAIPIGELTRNGAVTFCVDALPDAAMSWDVEALAADGRVLAQWPLPAQIATTCVAEGAAGYRFNLTVRGTLTRYLDAIGLEERAPPPLFLPGAGRLLLVTNGYPSTKRPYRNAFVHRRVLWYRRRGVAVDVVCAVRGLETTSYVYDGVIVTLCDPSVLRETLSLSQHDAIAVHFLDEYIWSAICDAASSTRTVVWVHGAEIQPYERRAFNFTTDIERTRAQRNSEARLAFWRRVVAGAPESLQLVFVSRTFAEETWSDLGVRLPEAQWRVIHNPIDDELFRFEPKDADARRNILSVRPHDSRIYANDLVASVIRGLSVYPEFSSLRFRLVGDGPLFDENFAGLGSFKNVTIERRLLRQSEVADLHREHGIFLVPTRGDTQGVSRDEAMASGLVPVTNLVGAVGDFTGPEEAILTGPDDVEGMVQGIRQLVKDPGRFLQMSQAAAARVRTQSAAAKIVRHELAALGLGNSVESTFSHAVAGAVPQG